MKPAWLPPSMENGLAVLLGLAGDHGKDNDMPYEDRSGPMGDGPGTGRGQGLCAGARSGFGRRRGNGRGAGRGLRIRRFGHLTAGQDSIEDLKSQATFLERKLDLVKKQLALDLPPTPDSE